MQVNVTSENVVLTPPFVSIVRGSSSLVNYVHTNTTFGLFSNAYVLQCDGNQQSNTLRYAWIVKCATNNDTNTYIPNHSKDPSQLLLPAYSLVPFS